MKKLLLILLVGGFITTTGCEKDLPAPTPPTIVEPPPTSPPQNFVNTPPSVSAGSNMSIYLPIDSTFLYGSAADAENNIVSYKWSQLSGPSQAIIQYPGLIKTKISKLIKGEYSFELTVFDSGNLSGKATVNVKVIDSSVGPNTMFFKDLYAGCWGGECLLGMDGSSIPRNIPIKVYFKSEDSLTWIEVSSYYFYMDKFFVQFGGNETHEAKKWEVLIRY